jgi:hypothetical protein
MADKSGRLKMSEQDTFKLAVGGAGNPFELRDRDEVQDDVHRYGRNLKIVCATEGLARPKDRDVSINEIVVGVGNVIALWDANVTLYWRFQERSFARFADPEAAKGRVRALLAKALEKWGEARPIAFEERDEGWDFEIVVRRGDECSPVGCVLASAFFPDNGQHRLTIYPRMFQQIEEEQIETLVHELGHVFGLRHFFAKVSESQIPSEIFGANVEFTIMNYGDKSTLTDADKSDLRKLYELARARTLKAINGTPITLVKPFSANRP